MILLSAPPETSGARRSLGVQRTAFVRRNRTFPAAGLRPDRRKKQRRGTVDFPAFYSYAYPVPAGFAEAKISPDGAYYDKGLGEFLLPYEDVRHAADPEHKLIGFLESTYRAAAELGRWDWMHSNAPSGGLGSRVHCRISNPDLLVQRFRQSAVRG